MPLLLLSLVVLAQAAPANDHPPPLSLARGGIEVGQYFSVKGIEKYTGETPRRVAGLDAAYDESLEHFGARSHVKATLRAREQGGVAAIDVMLKASLSKPAKGFDPGGFGAAAPQAWVMLNVDTKPTQGLVVVTDGNLAASAQGAEVSLDVLVDGREVAVLRTGKDLGKKLQIPLTPGPHVVWVEALSSARLPPKGKALSASLAMKVSVRIAVDEVAQPKPPAPIACETKPLRFPSPTLDDGAAHATHVWPNDVTLGSVQSPWPVFLLRVDRDVVPETLLADLMVTDGSFASWRNPRVRIRNCFKEREDERTWTTVVFDLRAPLRTSQDVVQWHLRAGDALKPLGPQAVHPLTHAQAASSLVGGAVVTTGRGLAQGGPFDPDGVAWSLDRVKLDPSLLWAELENDREALTLLQDWAGADVRQALKVVKRHTEALEKRLPEGQRLEVPYGRECRTSNAPVADEPDAPEPQRPAPH